MKKKKNKKDSIVEQVINKIKDWLSGNDKKNKSGEQLYSITMEKLITDISEKKVEKRIENEFTISKDSFRTQSQFDEKFNKIVNKHNNIDPIKLNKNKEEQMEEKGNIEKDQRIKGALDENKEYIFEENKDRSTVNSLENNKVTSTVNPEKLNKNKEEQMEEKGNIEKDQRIREALEEGKEHSGGVVDNNINKENGKTVINDEDYNEDDLDEFKNVETKNDNSMKNNNLNIDIKQQTQSGPSSPSVKISIQKVPQKSGVQSNQI